MNWLAWLRSLFGRERGADIMVREGRRLWWPKTELPLVATFQLDGGVWLGELDIATRWVNELIGRRVVMQAGWEALPPELADVWERDPRDPAVKWPSGTIHVRLQREEPNAYTNVEFDLLTGQVNAARMSLPPVGQIPAGLRQRMIRHELLHALLLDHSDVEESVMWWRLHRAPVLAGYHQRAGVGLLASEADRMRKEYR